MNPFEKFLKEKGYTVASFKALDTEKQADLQNEYLGSIESKLEGALTQADIDAAVKTQIDAFKAEREKTESEELKTLKDTVKVQGEKIVELNKSQGENPMNRETAEASFKKAYDEAKGESEEMTKGEPVKIALKDIASTSVMSVDTVSSGDFPAAGSSGVITSGMYAMWARFLGFFGLMSPESRIMDLVDVQPLSEGRLYAINWTIVGDAAVTPECELKPIVRMEFTDQTADADPVAAMWFTTTKLRRFWNNIASLFRTTFAELVNRKVPQAVLTAIRANASAFTPNALFNIDPDPNNYDALGAVIASIQNLGYMPNGILINPIAFRNMKQSKNENGTYNLSNGNSITIIGNGRGLDWNGVAIPIILDSTLGDDEFIVGDFFMTVKTGLDNELIYMETDGRVDGADPSVSGLAKNIRTHVLERFVATIIPNGTKTLIIRDTFANVKTLITAESPSV